MGVLVLPQDIHTGVESQGLVAGYLNPTTVSWQSGTFYPRGLELYDPVRSS